MDKLASIIIPVYNVEPYLKECLDSVINQSYKNLEILVVDDGSTDNSGSICDSYSYDSRVTIFHQPNGGLSVARNTALDHASGEYIFFVDSDDFMHPDLVSKAVTSLEATNADIVIFGHIRTQNNGSKEVIPPRSIGLSTIETSNRLISNQIDNYVWDKAFRGYLWKSRRFPPGINFEDLATVPYIAKSATKIVTLNEPLYYYRIHGASYLHSRTYDPSRDYMKITVLKSLEPLAFSTSDSLLASYLQGKILYDSIKLSMLNYYLNELSPNEVFSLEEYIKKDWDFGILRQLGFQTFLQRWLIVYAPYLARCYGKYRYQRKCNEET